MWRADFMIESLTDLQSFIKYKSSINTQGLDTSQREMARTRTENIIPIPEMGDVIIDANTGPSHFFHASIVVKNWMDPIPDSNLSAPYAIAVDYGLNKHYQMMIGFHTWIYYHDYMDAKHKYVFRFNFPKKINNIELGPKEIFYKAIQSSTVRLMKYYTKHHASYFSGKTFKTILNTALPNCGKPEFKHFDQRYETVNKCKASNTQEAKAILCSKFVIQSLQLGLFDWLNTDKNGNKLSSEIKKEIIKRILPIAAERCAPRYIRDVLLKNEYWTLVPMAKPIMLDKRIPEEVLKDLRSKECVAPSTGN
jgi:hypothetical protein